MLKLRKKNIAALLISVVAFALFTQIADARSLSGGKSFGRQSNNYSQRQAPAPQSAPAPQRTAPAAAPPPPAATPQPQPQRNRWLGPLAGLATGLGIAALMSHFGMGGALAENMGSMLLLAAVVLGGLFLWRRMRSNSNSPLLSGANQAQSLFDTQSAQPKAQPYLADATFGASPPSVAEFKPTWSIPADFDVDNFLHAAKVSYVRLQAGWDKADLDDIREFTTPEMFAEIKLQLNERGADINVTDVVSINAEMLGIENTSRDQLASVRFSGTLRTATNAPTEAFDEVWSLAKSLTNPAGWLLAGIQQTN